MTRGALLDRLGLSAPVILAPMAGGISTPQLVAAVSNAGGLGSLGAAYLTPDQLAAQLAQVRELTAGPVNVNLFVVSTPPPPGEAQVEAARAALRTFHDELGLPPAPLTPPEDLFDAQFEVTLRARPEVFSFTFGVLDARRVEQLKRAGILVVGTATTVREARALEDAGVDAVVAQGSEAGGHRGTFLGAFEDALIGTLALVPQLVGAVRVPVIASGGIMNGRGVRAALGLGASAAQLGTAFLLCPEAGTTPAYREALRGATDDATTITRAFSGRPARGLHNRVTRELPEDAVLPFPYQNELTRPLRSAAARESRAEFLSLWAGQAASLARAVPAAELVSTLAREAGWSSLLP